MSPFPHFLRKVCPLVYSLYEYLALISHETLYHSSITWLVKDSDTNSFKDFLHSTIIAFPEKECAKGIKHPELKPVKFEGDNGMLGIIRQFVGRAFDPMQPFNQNQLLCLGYQHKRDNHSMFSSGIDAIDNLRPNAAWIDMTNLNWNTLLNRVGFEVIEYLLQHCLIFKSVGTSKSCLMQISGYLLSQLVMAYNKPIYDKINGKSAQNLTKNLPDLAGWKIQRSLMFYSVLHPMIPLSVGVNKKFEVAGLPKDNALNLFNGPDDKYNTVVKRFLRYIFQRSVFHSEEPASYFLKSSAQDEIIKKGSKSKFKKLPKRIHKALPLFTKILHQHRNINYTKLLIQACPIKSPWRSSKNPKRFLEVTQNSGTPGSVTNSLSCASNESTGPVKQDWKYFAADSTAQISQKQWSWLDCSSSYNQVFKFISDVIMRMFPRSVFGSRKNKIAILNCIFMFIKLRKYETVSIHQLMQNIKICDIEWLAAPKGSHNQSVAEINDKLETQIADSNLPSLVSNDEIETQSIGVSKVVNANVSQNLRSRSKSSSVLLSISNTSSALDHKLRCDLFAQFLHFLFVDVVVPLLGANFYVTETCDNGNNLRYYRIPVWKQIVSTFLKTSVNPIASAMVTTETNFTFRELNNTNAEKILKTYNRELGFGSLRLLPRLGGVRPIVNLSNSYSFINGPSKVKTSVNKMLKTTLSILNHHAKQTPILLGASVYGLESLYCRLFSFVSKNKSSSSAFYFVSADVSKCFDKMDRSHIGKLMEEIVNQDYYAQKYFVLSQILSKYDVSTQDQGIKETRPNLSEFLPPDNNNVEYPVAKRFKSNNSESANPIRCKFLRNVSFSCDVTPLAHVVSDKHSTCVIEDLVNVDEITSKSTVKLLQEHIFSNVIKLRDIHGSVRNRYVMQQQGAPQGSVLSSYFCCALLGCLERSFLLKSIAQINQSTEIKVSGPNFVLARQMDDYMLLTTSFEIAQSFALRLKDGFKEYGVVFNNEKTKTNFSLTENKIETENVWKSWCGLLLNTRNLDMRYDYSRFSNVSESLTVESFKSGLNLLKKVYYYMSPRCHAILLDKRLHTWNNLRVNIYQMLLFTAVKVLTHLNSLQQYGLRSQKSHSSPFVFSLVEATWSNFFVLIRNRFQKGHQSMNTVKNSKGCNTSTNFKLRDCFTFTKAEITWFTLYSYYVVFGFENSRWDGFLSLLKNLIYSEKYKSIRLKYISFVSNPKYFSLFRSMQRFN